LLDVNQGELKYLMTLEPSKFQPSIQLGKVGDFPEGKLTVLGFVVRKVLFDRFYFWSEYLLYNPQVGYRWLVESDGHWSYVTTVSPGEVSDRQRFATYQRKQFQIFQDATATVDHVIGEFYWKVTTGEEVRAIDYIHPPQILTVELSNLASPQTYRLFGKNAIGWTHVEEGQSGRGEMNCSLGTYMKPAEVEKAFGISVLKRPWTVGPNQPNPYGSLKLAKYWAILTSLVVLVGFGLLVTGSNRQVFAQSFRFDKLPNVDGTQTVFSEPFQLAASKNIGIMAGSDVDNSWVYFEGDFINRDTGLVQPFTLPVEYYHGYDSDGAWTEGSQTTTTYLSALPAGTYTMRLEGQWEKWQQRSPSFNVRVVQGVPRASHFWIALGLVTILPLYALVRNRMFDVRRWSDSMYNAYKSGKDD